METEKGIDREKDIKMKNVAIVTIRGLNNYGNRLQNYAMQSNLKRLGYAVETVRFQNAKELKRRVKTEILKLLSVTLKSEQKRTITRRTKFDEFEKRICYSKPIKLNTDDRTLLNRYDYVVYGSDQIWNTEFKSFSKLFLGFNADCNKNVAVSASFGKDDIDPQYVELFRESYTNFKAVSVRENSGRSIIKRYMNADCPILPDPTIIVEKEEWESLESMVPVPEVYEFTYFLGEKPSIDYTEKNVINGEYGTSIGPSEFLFLIHHAKAVYTDSFHACVFCILYGTPFFVFKRESKYSSMMNRIDTLFKELGITAVEMTNCYYVSNEELQRKEIEQAIKSMRLKMDSYIMENMD